MVQAYAEEEENDVPVAARIAVVPSLLASARTMLPQAIEDLTHGSAMPRLRVIDDDDERFKVCSGPGKDPSD